MFRRCRIQNDSTTSADRRMGGSPIRRLRLTTFSSFLWLLMIGIGCSSLQGQEPAVPADLDGYAGILYLNHSRSLAQTILALAYSGHPPIVWVNAVAPNSWESLVVECGFNSVDFVSALPVNLATGLEGEQIEDDQSPLQIGEDLVCGSLIVIEISDGDIDAGEPVLLFDVHTIPAVVPQNAEQVTTSAISPGPSSNLLLVRFERILSVPTQFSVSWENPTGRVFVSRVDLADQGPVAATLLECPVQELGLGNVTDPTVPGAILTDAEIDVEGPPSLIEGIGFACGDLVTMRVVGNAAALSEASLEIVPTSQGAAVPFGSPDLFANIRQVLDEEGFAGRMSTNLALFPTPGVGSQSTP